ncbi:SoxR reducing system RseC family protein [Thermohalobacter berrensis]|uniref:Fis family transcriptional regulator n=1 Tax=Thermohalobacter berrensis TaxID=99594 RepID=A0A419T2P6_9FIRM|nr:SoxR reducing system RseC family protein [Thermohalobacter berrensis]RKD31787.1 hypothetical protein BET03_11945 [Thermohalobacter berrensis]
MEQIGFVIEANDEFATIEVRRISVCGDKCGSCQGGCRVPVTKVKIPNTLQVKTGEYVELKMENKKVIYSTFIVYGIPFIMMIVGMIGSYLLFKNLKISKHETLSFISGMISLGVSYFILNLIDKKMKEKNKINIKMIRKVSLQELI